MSNLIYTRNHDLPRLTAKTVEWHHDKDLINGSTAQIQADKFLEEAFELYAAVNYGTSAISIRNKIIDLTHGLYAKGKIREVSKADSREEVKDAIGDTDVVKINIAEQYELTISECLEQALNTITKRSGVKVDGVFVKGSDL